MESKRKQLGKPMCRRLSVLLICALILGMLPMPEAPVRAAGRQAAAEADAKAGQITLNNPIIDPNGVTTWDTIYFGSYWQNDTNGDGKADQEDEKEPIRWRVLSVDGDDVFLLADQNLDCRPYNDTWADVTWETCTLRSWLNDTFFNNAFTAAEQSAIRETIVENPDNPEYGTEGGNDTTDRVYLLSLDEMTNLKYGFSSIYKKARWAKNTEYAKTQGAFTYMQYEYDGNGEWWLRSPGYDSDYASGVSGTGYEDRNGDNVDYSSNAVRPALHLNLSSESGWSYAGTVNSEGEYKQSPSSRPTTTRKPVEGGVSGTLSNPTTDADGVTTWDTIYFGGYWQNDTNGDGKANLKDEKEPIRWRVLSVDGDDAFLLADQNLDCQRYNETYTDVTWETCTLRSWLNEIFLNNAFTDAEQSAIRETVVENPNNPKHGTEGGNDTTDQVYLLSIDEVINPEYGFDYKSRWAKNTEYIDERVAASHVAWWLRSPGYNSKYASIVHNDGGYVDRDGDHVTRDYYAARPALHLNLSSDSVWSYAGTVNSEGTYEQSSSPRPAATRKPIATRKPVESGVPATLSNPTIDAYGVNTWDTIYFGSYWQNDTNGDGKADQKDEKEPIRWRVLSVDGDDAFLLADRNLDCRPYNNIPENVTWKTCKLRRWLNDTFLNNAFTAAEQSAIWETVVENPDDPEYGSEGENDTTDQVYLLSIDEVTNPEYGFSLDYSRWAGNTSYAIAQGAYAKVQGEYKPFFYGNALWWLRSPGDDSSSASYVSGGGVCRDGDDVDHYGRAVRPALHLNLSSNSGWSYAGTVDFEGTYEQPSSPGPTATAKPTSTPTVIATASPAATRNPVESGVPGTLSNPTTDANGVTTWDTIYFGSYWQNDTNGDGKADPYDEKEPIRWRVLSVDGDDAFLLADQNLDCQRYDIYEYHGGQYVPWETCDLRRWLNDTFLNNAFTAVEQSAIRETVVENPNYPEFVGWGDDTTDQVYLLSIDEVANPEYGFSSNSDEHDKSRRVKNTKYARAKGATNAAPPLNGEYFFESGQWWLRSLGYYGTYVSIVHQHGHVCRDGASHGSNSVGVRPALHLNLSSDSGWSYAGTVNSEGTYEQPSSPAPTATAKPTSTLGPTTAAKPTSTPTVIATAPPAATTKPSATPTAPGTKPTENPDATPGITEQPSAEPSQMPAVTPEVTQTPNVSSNPAKTPAPSAPLPVTTPPAGQPVQPQSPVQVQSPPGITDISSDQPSVAGMAVKGGLKLAAGKKKLTLKWKKVANVSGYEIQVSRKKNFKGAKKLSLKNSKKSYTIKKLKRGKIYYVRIRAYIDIDGKKVYGKWVTAKKKVK